MDVPPELYHEVNDEILKIGGDCYFKASSYRQLETACQDSATDLEGMVLKVYAMEYISFTCCRSLEEVLEEDDGICSGVRISVVNRPFVEKKAATLKRLTPLLENCMELSVDLGKFVPNRDSSEDIITSNANQYLVTATEVKKRDVLEMEFDLKIENALHEAWKAHVDTLQWTLDKLELLTENLNNIFIEHNIFSDIKKEEDPLTSYLDVLDAKNEISISDCAEKEEDPVASSYLDVLDTKNESTVSDSEKAPLVNRKEALLTTNIDSADTKRENTLADRENQATAIGKSELQESNVDLSDDQYKDDDGFDCHLSMLIKENADVIGVMQNWFSKLPPLPDCKSIDKLLLGREEAADELIGAMMNEGLEIHETVKKLKPETHEHLYVEAGLCDICDAKISDSLRNSKSPARLKKYKEDLDTRYPQISSVKEHRILLLHKQGKFALSRFLWQTFKDLTEVLGSAMDKIHLQNKLLTDICNRRNSTGLRKV